MGQGERRAGVNYETVAGAYRDLEAATGRLAATSKLDSMEGITTQRGYPSRSRASAPVEL